MPSSEWEGEVKVVLDEGAKQELLALQASLSKLQAAIDELNAEMRLQKEERAGHDAASRLTIARLREIK